MTSGISDESLTPNYKDWKPNVNPWLIALTVIIPTFMEILDTTVTNVAIPHIAGSFSATYDEATWVLTSYLVSNAIILPTTAWFSSIIGRKLFLFLCIILFTASSLLCGVSNSIEMLIVARILQGIGGGTLQPVSQAILLESFPPSKVGVATAVFGIGVVCAPIIGPTLGGWITDNFTWRWIFYINIPIGIIALLMCHSFIEDPPYIKQSKVKSIDYVGFGFMAIGLAALQIMLDKGQQLEWFSSNIIKWLAIIAFITLLFFVIWELFTKDPIVDLKVLKDKNFAIGTILVFAIGAVLYGSLLILSLFMQNLMQYTAELAGMALSPRGIGSVIAIIIAGRLADKVDKRWILIFGFCLLAVSCFQLGNLNLQIAMNNVVIPNFLCGISLGCIMIPIMAMAFGTLEKAKIGNATGIFNLMRNIGGSVGISLTTSYITHRAQVHQNNLVGHLTPYDQEYLTQFKMMQQFFFTTGSDMVTSIYQSYQGIYNTLILQANLLAFMDSFRGFALIAVVMIPLILLFKEIKNPSEKIKGLH